jgi:hypothetical protein
MTAILPHQFDRSFSETLFETKPFQSLGLQTLHFLHRQELLLLVAEPSCCCHCLYCRPAGVVVGADLSKSDLEAPEVLERTVGANCWMMIVYFIKNVDA